MSFIVIIAEMKCLNAGHLFQTTTTFLFY